MSVHTVTCPSTMHKKRLAVIFANLTFILTSLERYTEIERENRILLEKMTNILQKQRGTLFSANSAGAVGAGGFS